jgi:hypothetical protein
LVQLTRELTPLKETHDTNTDTNGHSYTESIIIINDNLKQKKSGEKTRRRAKKQSDSLEKTTDEVGINHEGHEDHDEDSDEEDEEEDDEEQFVVLDDNGDAVYIPYDESNNSTLNIAVEPTNSSISTVFKTDIASNDINIADLSLKTINTKPSSSKEEAPDPTLYRHFADNTKPSPRINACIMIRGSTLFVYGGVTEIGDIEITCDDCWSLNLGKLDNWKNILPGTMHLSTWKGEDLEGTDGTRSDDDEDDDQDNNDEEDDDDSDSDDDTNTPQKAGGGSKPTLNLSDTNRIPLPGEALKDFYSRTFEYWCQEVAEANTGVSLNEKQIKNESFKLAKQKYDEINVSAGTVDDGDDGEERATSKKDKDNNKNRIKRRGV